MVGPEADWTRRQLDKKRFHDKRPVSCCFLARGERGGLGEERVSDRDIGEKRGGSVVKSVQCLKGPLLWVTESETFKKAERIRLKDLSERDVTSSVVIPFVSIFGRIFNLMVPAEAEENFTVRSLQNGEQPFADRGMKKGLFVNYKNEEKSRTIYLI